MWLTNFCIKKLRWYKHGTWNSHTRQQPSAPLSCTCLQIKLLKGTFSFVQIIHHCLASYQTFVLYTNIFCNVRINVVQVEVSMYPILLTWAWYTLEHVCMWCIEHVSGCTQWKGWHQRSVTLYRSRVHFNHSTPVHSYLQMTLSREWHGRVTSSYLVWWFHVRYIEYFLRCHWKFAQYHICHGQWRKMVSCHFAMACKELSYLIYKTNGAVYIKHNTVYKLEHMIRPLCCQHNLV